MNQLIPLQKTHFNGELQETVDARTLHERLGAGRDFSTWIKARIEQCGYAENVDYIVLPVRGERENQGLSRFIPGGNRIDYAITIEMAQEISMMEGTEQGRQYRRYFINLEKKAKVQHGQLQALQAVFLKANPKFTKIKRYFDLGLNNYEVARLLGVNESTIRKNKAQMRSLGLLPDAGNGVMAQIEKRG